MSDLSSHPVAESSLIDVVKLAACLGDVACRVNVQTLAECASTNLVLLQNCSTDGALAASGAVLVADRQTAGRGRRGRRWLSAQLRPDDSLTFSLLWRFPRATSLSGLSLAVGVALAAAIAELGGTGLRLKWPNDLLFATHDGLAKLGGILIELSSSSAGTAAVIGVGLNLRPPREVVPDQLAAGIASLMVNDLPERHVLLAALLRHLVRTLDQFAAQGFAPMRAAWENANAYAGLPVRLIEEAAPEVVGRCLGVDDDGALRVETEAGIRRWLAGDVTLRVVTPGG